MRSDTVLCEIFFFFKAVAMRCVVTADPIENANKNIACKVHQEGC